MPGLDTNVGAKRARQARERLGLDPGAPLDCVLRVVEDAGLPVVIATLPRNVAGACTATPRAAWVNGTQPLVRQRFTVAHEFGHVCCGHEATPVDTEAVVAGRTHDPREVQANAFAAELLAPRAGIEVGSDPSLEDVAALAGRFGVSLLVALYRCSTLGLVSDARLLRLREELEDDRTRAYLTPQPFADGLAAIGDLPRIPAALEGSALAAVLRGDASVEAGAAVAGVDPTRLGAAAADLLR